MLVPPKPVSDEPIESVITRLGSSSSSFSLMLVENNAAVLASRNSDERSRLVPSPCLLQHLQRVEQWPGHRVAGEEQQVHLVIVIARQTSSASNSGAKTVVWPEKIDIQVADCVAPWIIGGIG